MRRRLGACLLLLAAGGAQATDPFGVVDPARSQAGFTVRVMLVRKLEGRFEFVQGVVSPTPLPGHFDVEVKLAAQSLVMHNPEHADWARSAEFFDAPGYPWIAFRARNAPLSLLTAGGELSGELSLRGVTRPASFELLPGACARPGFDCAIEAHGEVQRSDFGMDARRWAVSDKVKLALSLRLKDAGADS